MSAFFVTGLPCSRTAWIANWLSTGNAFCFHDLLGRVKSMQEFLTVMGTEAPRTGDSDSGLLACYAQVQATFPESPWLLVRRDFEDAWQSLCTFAMTGPWSDQLPLTAEVKERMREDWEKARLELVKSRFVMEVPFTSLDNTDTLERIWRHLCPKYAFDRRRTMHLQNFRVQVWQEKAPARPRLSLLGELYPAGMPAGSIMNLQP